MCRKIIFMLVVFIFIFAFPKMANGENVYYLCYDEFENEITGCDSFEFLGPFTNEEKAGILFEILFSGNYNFTPKKVKVIGVSIKDGTLTLNVSGGIQSYGGGNGFERRLVYQIIKTALDIPTVDRVTLLIEGFSDYLPEGTKLYEESAVPEL